MHCHYHSCLLLFLQLSILDHHTIIQRLKSDLASCSDEGNCNSLRRKIIQLQLRLQRMREVRRGGKEEERRRREEMVKGERGKKDDDGEHFTNRTDIHTPHPLTPSSPHIPHTHYS